MFSDQLSVASIDRRIRSWRAVQSPISDARLDNVARVEKNRASPFVMPRRDERKKNQR